ncbi:MAG TPA: hypothetical protein VJB70_02900 [Candidatus Paceibacterota bacterium]
MFSFALFNVFLVLLLAGLLLFVLLVFLAVFGEDEKNFWSEWHPFVDKKRRRIVLESTSAGWTALQELPSGLKTKLIRVFYKPFRPLWYLGCQKTVALVTGSVKPFEGDREFWDSYFGKPPKEPDKISVLA